MTGRESHSDRLRRLARAVRRDLAALWLAARDPRVSRLAKGLAAAVVAYAVSPVDLIPDFVPVLGLLDDVVLVPLGIWLVVRMVPPAVMAELRERAGTARPGTSGRIAAVAIVGIWAAAAAAGFRWLLG